MAKMFQYGEPGEVVKTHVCSDCGAILDSISLHEHCNIHRKLDNV